MLYWAIKVIFIISRHTKADSSSEVNIPIISNTQYEPALNRRIAGTKCFIERTNENKIRIEISYNPPDAIYIDDLESDTSIDQDSLDDLVVGGMNRERAIDCPKGQDQENEFNDRVSPFKRRPPIRQIKVNIM